MQTPVGTVPTSDGNAPTLDGREPLVPGTPEELRYRARFRDDDVPVVD